MTQNSYPKPSEARAWTVSQMRNYAEKIKDETPIDSVELMHLANRIEKNRLKLGDSELLLDFFHKQATEKAITDR